MNEKTLHLDKKSAVVGGLNLSQTKIFGTPLPLFYFTAHRISRSFY